jgi:hypothetical protein
VLPAIANDVEWYEAEGMPYGGLYHGPKAVAESVFGRLIETSRTFRRRRRR